MGLMESGCDARTRRSRAAAVRHNGKIPAPYELYTMLLIDGGVGVWAAFDRAAEWPTRTRRLYESHKPDKGPIAAN